MYRFSGQVIHSKLFSMTVLSPEGRSERILGSLRERLVQSPTSRKIFLKISLPFRKDVRTEKEKYWKKLGKTFFQLIWSKTRNNKKNEHPDIFREVEDFLQGQLDFEPEFRTPFGT